MIPTFSESPGLKTGPQLETVVAFRQAKTIEEWSLDPRCRVSLEELRQRLHQGWIPEDAILVPRGETPPPPPSRQKRRWIPEPNSEPFPERIPGSALSLAPAWVIKEGARSSPRKPTVIKATAKPSSALSLAVPADAAIYVVDLTCCDDLPPQELLLLAPLRNHCSEKAIGLSIFVTAGGMPHSLLESMGLEKSIPVRFSLLDALKAAREDRRHTLQQQQSGRQSNLSQPRVLAA